MKTDGPCRSVRASRSSSKAYSVAPEAVMTIRPRPSPAPSAPDAAAGKALSPSIASAARARTPREKAPP
ncbi:hypothetical protein LUW77_15610 [Streptomyces radiopugnans]|nr:hypothetical protein LUW77_15610 [Streptomyces radiopugnans]